MTRFFQLFLALSLVAPALAQDSTFVIRPHRVVMVQDDHSMNPDEPESGGIRFDGEALLTNVYESNIDHSSDGISSIGFVPALHLRLRDRPHDTRFTFDYVLARHAYTNTERWDRTSHLFSLAYEVEPADDLTSETEAEVAFRGSSEDRDLANQYQIRQTFEAKLSRMHRVEMYGTLRYKTVPNDPERNAFKPNVGLRYQQRWPSGIRWEIGARWETNREALELGDYNRTTYTAELRIPVFAGRNYVELEVRRRSKHYTARFAEDEEGDVTDPLRQDRKWSVGLVWRQTLTTHVVGAFGVEVERRTSNDPEKLYVASSLLIGLIYRF